MKRKKLSALLAALLLLAALCACGGAGSAVPAVTFTPEPTATPTPSPLPTSEPTPSPAPTASVQVTRLPILMYHEVSAPEQNSLYLSPDNFQSQLDWLEENGWTPITMAQLADHWINGTRLPDKPIVLTFDDGYVSMYNEVYPRLAEKGWSATFYAVTSYTGTEDGGEFLSSRQMREMADNGMEIGSHTVSHLNLDEMDYDSIARELSDSMALLEEYTGHSVVSLCYPAGRCDERVIECAQAAGYLTAVTTAYGIADEAEGPFALSRVRISTGMDGAALGLALSALGF